MRNQIFDTLYQRMATNPNLFLVTADMGLGLIERFQQNYPDRTLNVGIAEQNLIGVSSGLCNLGYRPFAYTISNFLIHRCFEQIRNDICLHRYPVTLMGTSGGFDNAPLGPTHHVVDEWGVLKGLPNIDIYCPCSVPYALGLIDKVLERERPAYIRIPKGASETPASTEDAVYCPGESNGVLLASYGPYVQFCLNAANAYKHVSVLALNRLRPLDEEFLTPLLSRHERLIVVEDHFAHSGLYNSFCQFCMEAALRIQIRSLAPTDYNLTVGGSSSYYDRLYGMDEAGIRRCIESAA